MDWESLPGLRYRVYGSADLVVWTALTPIDATGAVSSFSSQIGEGERFFYRVVHEGVPE